MLGSNLAATAQYSYPIVGVAGKGGNLPVMLCLPGISRAKSEVLDSVFIRSYAPQHFILKRLQFSMIKLAFKYTFLDALAETFQHPCHTLQTARVRDVIDHKISVGHRGC